MLRQTCLRLHFRASEKKLRQGHRHRSQDKYFQRRRGTSENGRRRDARRRRTPGNGLDLQHRGSGIPDQMPYTETHAGIEHGIETFPVMRQCGNGASPNAMSRIALQLQVRLRAKRVPAWKTALGKPRLPRSGFGKLGIESSTGSAVAHAAFRKSLVVGPQQRVLQRHPTTPSELSGAVLRG